MTMYRYAARDRILVDTSGPDRSSTERQRRATSGRRTVYAERDGSGRVRTALVSLRAGAGAALCRKTPSIRAVALESTLSNGYRAKVFRSGATRHHHRQRRRVRSCPSVNCARSRARKYYGVGLRVADVAEETRAWHVDCVCIPPTHVHTSPRQLGGPVDGNVAYVPAQVTASGRDDTR